MAAQTETERMFDKDVLVKRNEQFLADLRSWHSEREVGEENPRAVQPEYDVRYRRRVTEHWSWCSSSAGWDT